MIRRIFTRVSILFVLFMSVDSTSARRQTSATWPDFRAYYVAEIIKGVDGVENIIYTDVGDRFNNTICDLQDVGSSCALTLVINSGPLGPYPAGATSAEYPDGVYRAAEYEGTFDEPPCARTDPEVCLTTPDMMVKYYVRGVPVSDWIAYPYNFTLARNDADMAALCDGVHDLSIDVQSGTIDDRAHFRYYPMQVRLALGNSACTSVPSGMREAEYFTYQYGQTTMGSRVRYISYDDVNFVGYPAPENVFTPWSERPDLADLYQEEMMPHTEQFMGAPMWWAIPDGRPLGGTPYLRNLGPKWDEQHAGLRVTWQHEKFPIKDGPRGVGWTSPYITGIVDSNNVFWFVENGQGAFRKMDPDGEITTIAGWVTDPAKHPIYLNETIATIRQNQVLRGEWPTTNGCTWGGVGGFFSPMDVTQDPNDATVFYVSEFEGNRICKVDIDGGTGGIALVTRFAGAIAAGYENGTGSAARFDGPLGIVADPVCDCLYVADSRNDAIRKITIPGAVVTKVIGKDPDDLITYYKIAHGADGTDPWPTYLEFTPNDYNHYQYVAPGGTTDADALEKFDGSGDAARAVGVWFTATDMTFEFDFTGGESHEVSFYFVDWDADGRTQTIELYDSSMSLLDSRTVSSFTSGKYLTWNVTGKVTFKIIRTVGTNAVVSGIFLDPGVAGNAFIGTDTTTRGDWVGVYGTDAGKNIGYSIIRGGAEAIAGQYYHQQSARESTASNYEVTALEAAAGKRPDLNYPFALKVASDGDLIWNDVAYGAIRRMDISTYETYEITTQQITQSQIGYYTQAGWSWLDVDRWGNSGPLDGVYYGAFQASFCSGTGINRPNESYCWAPGDGSAQGTNIFEDNDSAPNGWGVVEFTDPPHYMWLFAVSPNGGVYMAGGGEHGITRLRKQRDIDPVPSNYTNYLNAERYYWKFGSGFSGSGNTGPVYGTSFILKFGSECHNYIGMPDCWAIADEVYNDTITDEEIITMFELDEDLLDEGNIDIVIEYIRLNAGPPTDESEPEPPVRRLQLPFRIKGDHVLWLLMGCTLFLGWRRKS